MAFFPEIFLQWGERMNRIMVLAGGITLAMVSTAFAADNVVVSVPGVEIRVHKAAFAIQEGVEIGPGGSVKAPGVEIGSGRVASVPGVEVSSGGRVETPGVVIDQGSGDGDVVITTDGGHINTAVSNQNLYVNGSNNKMKGAGRVLTLTVHGDNNVIELEDEVARVVVTGSNNNITFPNDDAEIDDTGNNNRFPKG